MQIIPLCLRGAERQMTCTATTAEQAAEVADVIGVIGVAPLNLPV
jgi:hypothetical protein